MGNEGGEVQQISRGKTGAVPLEDLNILRLFTTQQWYDICDAAMERDTQVSELIREAVLNDIYR